MEKRTKIEKGKKYFLSGDIKNGRCSDGTVRLTHEEVTRRVSRVTCNEIVCECGRVFVINSNLKIREM